MHAPATTSTPVPLRSTPATVRATTRASTRPSARTAQLGAILLAAYVIQGLAGAEVAWLLALQARDNFAIPSGCLVAIYVLHQARLGRRRNDHPARAVRRHEILGALAPVVLYVHASRFAYGYLVVLALVYLGTTALGLAHQGVIGKRSPRLFAIWFIAHVLLAILLLVLVGYHALVALAYE